MYDKKTLKSLTKHALDPSPPERDVLYKGEIWKSSSWIDVSLNKQ